MPHLNAAAQLRRSPRTLQPPGGTPAGTPAAPDTCARVDRERTKSAPARRRVDPFAEDGDAVAERRLDELRRVMEEPPVRVPPRLRRFGTPV